MTEKEDDVPPWRTLIYDFTQDTTLHGLHYITIYSRYFARRVIWAIVVIAALALFISINIQNLWTYYRYPTTVNVEVNYKSPLTFPAVTICNYNAHRLTAVSEMGLYDTLWRYYTPMMSGADDYYADTYEYLEGLCIYSEDEKLQLLNAQPVTHTFEFISQVACEKICALLYADECSGLFYNRTSKQCEITSAVIEPGSYVNRTCTEDSLEYYRRKLNVVPVDMTCSFESSDGCYMFPRAVQAGSTYQDYWVTSQASRHVPDTDNSLSSGRGHYIAMQRNSARRGMSARFQSTRMLINDSCLAFYYNIVGYDASITVNTIDEELRVNNMSGYCTAAPASIAVENGVDVAKWRRVFCPLKSGIHQVVIDGQRGEYATSSLALDDVTIWPCNRYMTECKRTSSGIDYMGDKSYTIDGHPCVNWTDSWQGTLRLLPSMSNSTCRNPDGIFEQPFCYIDNYPYVGYCDIPDCACESGYMDCLNGRCLPSSVFCDGVDDCGDFSDENERHCAMYQSPTCTFEEPYLCGYRSPGALQWSRVMGEQIQDGIGPSRDSSGTVSGHFMYVHPGYGVSGDIFRFMSPQFLASSSDCVGFSYFVNIPPTASDTFSVYTQDVITGTKSLVISFHGGTGTWGITIHTLWKSGLSQLVFEYTKGAPFTSTVAFDDVHITSCSQSVTTAPSVDESQDTSENTSLSCDFTSGNRCGYHGESDQMHAVWSPTRDVDPLYPLDEMPAAPPLCSKYYIDGEGLIQHPSYPQSYSNNVDMCVAQIAAPPGTSVVLEVIFFDLEFSVDCEFDVLEIYEGALSPENIRYHLCGQIVGSNDVLQFSGEVYIWLKTDSAYTGRGFQFRYSMQPFPRENGMTLRYSGPSTETVYSATLSSDWHEVVGEMCLSYALSVAANTAFHTIWVDSTSMAEEMLFSFPGISTRIPWNIIHHNISAVNGTNYRIKFLVNFSGKYPGNVAVLDNITLAQSPCGGGFHIEISESASSNPTCDFSTSGSTLCGFVDNSPILPGWILRDVVIPWEERGPHVALVPYFTRKLNQEAAIIFPSIHTTESSSTCVELQWSVLSGEDMRITAEIMAPSLNRTLSSVLDIVVFCYQFGYQGLIGWKVANSDSMRFVVILDVPRGLQQASLLVRVQGHLLEEVALHQVIFHDVDNCDSVTLATSELLFAEHLTVLKFEDEHVNFMCQDPGSSIGIDDGSYGQFSFQDLFDTEIIPQETFEVVRQAGDPPVPVPAIETSVSEFYLSTAHRMEDFVYRCLYNGEPCANNSLTTSVTDFGVCVTFNSVELSSPQTSTKPGSRHGLQLMLNVEQYEHMAGSNTDAGVKINLHHQQDLANIRDQGIAVPLASHSLVAARYMQTISLGPPYGVCGTESLRLYPNESYSFPRCLLECNSYSLMEECGCKHHYMKGNTSYCTVKQLLECIIPVWESVSSEEKCRCRDACDIVAFEVEPSSTSFSSLGLSQFLNDNLTLVNNRREESVAVRKRFDPDELYALLSNVNAAMMSIDKFILNAQFTAMAGQNSPYYLVEQSIHTLANITSLDINILLGNLGEYRNDYNGALGDKQEAIISQINGAAHDLELFLELLGSISSEGDLPLIKITTGNLHTKLQISRKYLDINFESIRLAAYVQYEYIPENPIISTEPCSQSIDNAENLKLMLSETLINLEELTTLSSAEIIIDDVLSASSYEELLRSLKDFTSTFSLCYGEYRRRLDVLIDWHQSLDLVDVHDTVMDLSFELDIDSIKSAMEGLSYTYSLFVDNSIGIQGFVERFTENHENIMTKIKMLQSRIEGELDRPLRDLITQTQKRCVDAYLSSLDGLQGLQEYMGSVVDFASQASAMDVWRRPVSSIMEDNIISFLYSQSEAMANWPSDQDLGMYMFNQGRQIIEEVFASFMQEMRRHLDENKAGLNEDIAETEKALDDIKKIVDEYNASITIDENFLQRNFLALDVYYGELRYELIEQLPLYQLEDFFSDMGGYMGLLLGASAMTVIELLDLIFYNCLRKCCDRNKVKKENVKLTHLGKVDGDAV